MRLFRNVLIAGAVSSFLLTGCNSRSTTLLTYYETQCADAYSHGSNTAEHITHIDQYLITNGVNALDIDLETEPDSAMVCLACTCLSGMKVTIEVDNADVAEANALGFN
jgi:hypothetical protein